jgi:outer membrane biosynthesis protein TonB
MRLSFFPSLALHIGAIAVFLPAISDAWQSEAPPMMILPVELLEIADTTNMTAASEAVKEEEEPEVAPTPAEAAPPPPPPEPEEEILPTEEPPPKKQPEQKKPEPKQEKQDFESALKDLVRSAQDAPSPAPKKAAPDASAASEGAPRMNAGDRRRMTMTVGDAILQQLIAKGCWNSQADMADARRLRAVIAIRFGRDGRFLAEPRLVEPTREPSNDPPLQVYIQRARSGLAKCNQMGFQVPEQYFEVQPPQTIELDFRPCRAGEC